MDKTNQQGKVNGLANWTGAKGGKRSERNKKRLLLWVYRWRWVTEKVVQRLIGCVRRPCSDYVKRGWLKKIAPKKGFKTVYVIGRGFLKEAKELHELETQIVGMPYTQNRTAIPFLELGNHNEEAQLAALDAIEQHCGIEDSGLNFRTEWELRYCNMQGAIPDFTISAYDPDRDHLWTIWYELERTSKYHEEFYAQLKAREDARQKGQFQELVWICKGYSMCNKIAEALQVELIPQVYRRNDGCLAYDSTIEGWNPKELYRACRFEAQA